MGNLADCFDTLATVEETNDPAWAGFQSLVTPGKCADQAALIENRFDIAANIFGVDQTFLKCPAMEREDICPNAPSGFVVGVFEPPEEIFAALSDSPFEFSGEIGAHKTYRGIHGMIP